MKVNLIKVSRYSYEDKEGVIHEGTTFDCLIPVASDNQDAVGYDVRSYRTDYSHYNKILNLYTENKPVELSLEYVQMRNGNYYAKATKLNDIDL